MFSTSPSNITGVSVYSIVRRTSPARVNPSSELTRAFCVKPGGFAANKGAMNSKTAMSAALALGVVAFLLAIVATYIRYARGQDWDYFHLISMVALLFFIIMTARNRARKN